MKTIELFAGIGGLALGAQAAGVDTVAAFDIWADAVDTFNHNLGNKAHVADLSIVAPEKILEIANCGIGELDILSGGPPCQGFSTVGKRDIRDKRNQLFKSFLSIAKHVKPRYLIIENVEGIVVMKNGAVAREMSTMLNEMGYAVDWRIVQSCDFGVPQLRKRFILIASSYGEKQALIPTPRPSAYLTVEDAIGDLPPLNSGQSTFCYSSPPLTRYQAELRGENTSLHNHEAARHSADLVKAISFIPDGGNRKSIPDEFQPKSGFHNSYARLASWKPAVAVTSNMRKPSSARCVHPFQNRGLTVREGLRLQGFPDSFEILGSRTSQYLQVGNAVPPILAKSIFDAIIDAAASESKPKAKENQSTFIQQSLIPVAC
jgi:DNA (cytosine-5)-methyltransferase 1